MTPARLGIIIALLATTLLGATGALVYRFAQRQNQPPTGATSVSPPQTLSPPTSFSDAVNTADWKTYGTDRYATTYGSAYKFSIKFPENWRLREHDSGAGVDIAFLSPDYITPQKGLIEEITKGSRIEVFIYQDQTFPNLENWFDSFYKNPYLHSISKRPQRVTITPDVQGIEYELIGNIGLEETIHAKAFSLGNTVYLFQAVFKENAPYYTSILNQILSTFKFTISDQEKLLIDSWLQKHNLNQYGDPKDTMYAGGTPLFDERTGERVDRYEYILKKFPERPWNQ